MNKEEFNLSEKIDFEEVDRGIAGKFSRASILVSDVKEFMRLLKEKFEYMPYSRIHYGKDIMKEIDKLAGEKLI
jgi:hypothetical protein